MNIKLLIEESDLKDYDDLISNSKCATIFHERRWLDGYKRVNDRYFVDYYGIYDNNGELISVVPLTYFKYLGQNIISLPKLTPYLGPIMNKDDTYEALRNYKKISIEKDVHKNVVSVINSTGICMNYRFNSSINDFQVYRWNNYDVRLKYTYKIYADDVESLWLGLDRKLRNDIRNVEKKDIEIKLGDVNQFILLNKVRMEDKKHEIVNSNYWKLIYDTFGETNAEIMTIYVSGDAVSSIFLVWDDRCAYYLGGGGGYGVRGASSKLLWDTINYIFTNLNLNVFDFEGSNVESIEYYFRKFNGFLEPIYYIERRDLPFHFVNMMNSLRRRMGVIL